MVDIGDNLHTRPSNKLRPCAEERTVLCRPLSLGGRLGTMGLLNLNGKTGGRRDQLFVDRKYFRIGTLRPTDGGSV